MAHQRVFQTKTTEANRKKSRSPSYQPLLREPAQVNTILQLQQAVGNQAVQRMLHSGAIQAKLRIGKPGDVYEQEADRVSEQVMRMPDPQTHETAPVSGRANTPQLQRECAECPEKEEEGLQLKPLADSITPLLQRQTEEEDLQAKEVPGQTSKTGPALEAHINNVRGGGRPLSGSERAFFEPRFGHDFNKVRVHADSRATQSAQSINARAYTFRKQIVFGPNSYHPQTSAGRQLLAHELTHVVQQNGSSEAADSIQRTVASNSRCAANAHEAPADPLAALRDIDALAQNMSLSASHLLFLESHLFDDPNFGRSPVFDAYRDWFGTPQQTTSAWRSRFRSATFATEEEAMAYEMQVLSNRFERIHRWLARDIRYRCPGTSKFTIPGGCRNVTCGTSGAATCPTGSRTIAICPKFWSKKQNRDLQAGYLIHEAIHPLFDFRDHSTANLRGRGRNPGCYQGFIYSIFSPNLLPGDCRVI